MAEAPGNYCEDWSVITTTPTPSQTPLLSIPHPFYYFTDCEESWEPSAGVLELSLSPIVFILQQPWVENVSKGVKTVYLKEEYVMFLYLNCDTFLIYVETGRGGMRILGQSQEGGNIF